MKCFATDEERTEFPDNGRELAAEETGRRTDGAEKVLASARFSVQASRAEWPSGVVVRRPRTALSDPPTTAAFLLAGRAEEGLIFPGPTCGE